MSHEGDVYIVSGWNVYCDPSQKTNLWYGKESSGEATWDFPRHDAETVFSKRDIPNGWEVFRDEDGGYWWWNEARNFYTYNHPKLRSITTLGVFEAAGVSWDFNKLESDAVLRFVKEMVRALTSLLQNHEFGLGLAY